MQKLAFTKMHGLGNDFIVIDNMRGDVRLKESWIRSLSDRNTGIGFDQLLIVERATSDDVEFDYRIYNADGLEVEHCGNGARCFARFVRDKGLTNSSTIPVNTSGGRIELRVLDDDLVTVAMGVPNFDPECIPMQINSQVSVQKEQDGAPLYHLPLPLNTPEFDGIVLDGLKQFDHHSGRLAFFATSIGNPHAVILVTDVATAPVHQIGAWLETHAVFPQRVNVGFLQIQARDRAKLRVFERGVGETRACGTGACAAVAAGHFHGLFENEVSISLPGGSLDIFWPSDKRDIEMTGPCTTVFEGLIEM